MTSLPASPPLARMTRVQWLICVIAAVGFAFDMYELLMLPLIAKPALESLLHTKAGSPEFKHWVGILFYVPAIAGGIFGLIGGWLTDVFGRKKVLVWSILVYAFSAMAAGYATSVEWLLFFRCTTFVGVCVEFVAAVAWLAELFPEPARRERVLGYTQAFSSLGGLLVAFANFYAVKLADHLPAIHGVHEAWRYTLISGVIPALPLILIRPFVPESPLWREKKIQGALGRPSIAELFRPAFRRTTIVTTLIMACVYAAAFGAIQQTPQIVPGLPEAAGLKPPAVQLLAADVQKWQEVGGLAGRFLLAFLAVRIVSRRSLLRIFQVPGLIVIPLVFLYPATTSLPALKYGIFIAGLLNIAQFSFWGNYLPRVYPTRLRGTGESFAANIGGRMIGTSAAYFVPMIQGHMPGGTPQIQLAHAAALVALGVYVVAVAASFFLPEPKEGDLAE